MNSIVTLFSAAFLAAFLTGCQSENKAEAPKATQYQIIKAHVQAVKLGTIPLTTVVPGSVVPDKKAKITSRLIGYIKSLNLKVGQKVKRGQLLFAIDSSDVKSGINKAKAGYAQALAALDDAKLDYDRFSKLYAEASVSKQQFDKISLKYQVAQQNLAAAQANLVQAKAQVKYSNVRAPFDGVVVKKLAVTGDLASPGQPVLILENRKSLSVQTQVAGDLYAVLHLGDEVDIVIDGQPKPVKGTIYTLVSAADPATRTHTVKLSLPSIKNINSGTFARVNFITGERQTLVVPKSAILNRSGIEGVFVVENGIAYFHMVRLGEDLGKNIEVQSGVSLGDHIVIDHNMSLLNGDHVVALSAK